MTRYRHALPQLEGGIFLADGGLETTLVFHEGIELPHFAAFDLLRRDAGVAMLQRYFAQYVQIARDRGCGIVLETPTWRANRDWAARLGYDAAALREANFAAVDLLLEIRKQHETQQTRIVVSGNVGPRGDGYRPDSRMTVQAARDYHVEQIAAFAATEADMVAAFTMNYAEEAAGIALAAREHAMPLALSFTVETDGLLPSGETLAGAIEMVEQRSGGYPAYYMINCAHPSHFVRMLDALGALAARVRGIRANASRRSHAELDASTEIDIGDPDELSQDYAQLRSRLPALAVAGGCCGTDHRHIAKIGDVLLGRSHDSNAMEGSK